jgi:hypothetical protein
MCLKEFSEGGYILGVPLVCGELEYGSCWEVIDDDEVDADEEVF